MSSNQKHPATGQPQPSDLPSVAVESSTRRRLIKGGLAASPVVAVLKSRQVLAGTSGSIQCRSVSAYVSGSSHLSHHPEEEPCYGLTPGYWQTHPEEWPSPYEPGDCSGTDEKNVDKKSRRTKSASVGTCTTWSGDGTKIKDVWISATSPYRDNTEPTMMQILWWTGGEDRYQQGAHLVAALLNNKSGKVSESILPWARIIAMGNAVLAGKNYVDPSLGISWSGEDVVTYLKQTMTL